MSTAYACANVVIIPLSAWLGDRFGRKNYFVFSLVGFTVSSVLCGLSPNLGFLIAARVLQGLAGGGLLAKAQSVVFESFAPAERGAAQAIFGLGVIAGPALGPVLGGWLTDHMGWRWIFFINIPFGILAVLMCTTFFPADEPEKLDRTRPRRLDGHRPARRRAGLLPDDAGGGPAGRLVLLGFHHDDGLPGRRGHRRCSSGGNCAWTSPPWTCACCAIAP